MKLPRIFIKWFRTVDVHANLIDSRYIFLVLSKFLYVLHILFRAKNSFGENIFKEFFLFADLPRNEMVIMPLKWWFINILNIPNRNTWFARDKKGLFCRYYWFCCCFQTMTKHSIEDHIQIAAEESQLFTVSRIFIYKINGEYIREEESSFFLLFSKNTKHYIETLT